MKEILLSLLLLMSGPLLALPQQVVVTVPGMVCQMCVQGMKKAFKDVVQDPDKDIIVDLNTKQVKLNLKVNLSDDEIKKRVADTAYNVKKIERIATKKRP